eukprot:1021625-Amphidinium_carterae.1
MGVILCWRDASSQSMRRSIVDDLFCSPARHRVLLRFFDARDDTFKHMEEQGAQTVSASPRPELPFFLASLFGV